MKFPSAHILNLLGAFVSALLLATGFYISYLSNLEPCSLCILQRVVYLLLAILLFIACLHHPKQHGIRIYAGLTILTAALGVFLAGRQVWLQLTPHTSTEVCMPSFFHIISYLPFDQALHTLLMGSGDCANIDWTLFGWSIAAWSLLFFSLFVLLGILQIVISYHNKI